MGRPAIAGWVLALIVVIAGGLRCWRLDTVPPAAWIDEAIQGIQGGARVRGETLPPVAASGYQPMPVWVVPEAVAIRLGGERLGVIRMPAALAGVLAVGVAFLAGRVVAGPLAGLGAAAFLMGSFWHIQYCRLALPCVFVVTEGLLVAWLLLGRTPPGLAAGLGLAVLCVAAPYGYAASLITPVAIVALLAIRWFGAPGERPGRGFVAIQAAGLVCLLAAVIVWRPQGLLRSAELASEHHDPLAGQVLTWFKSVVWSTAPGWGYWRNYPPGAPRFSPIELFAAVCGAVAIWWTDGLARWQKWGWTGWALICVLPEWFGGEAPHLSRGLPQLAPAAVAAGVAVAVLARRIGRAGPAGMLALLAVNTGLTAHRLVFGFARDPLVAAWYLKPTRDAADGILAEAAKGPVALSGTLDYGTDPQLLYYLGPAVRRGAIVMTPDRPGSLFPVATFYDSSTGQPTSVLFDARRPWHGRRLLQLVMMDQLFERPEQLASTGRLADALNEYLKIFGLLKNSARAREGIGLILLRQGNAREAIPHLEYALSCHPDDQTRALLVDSLDQARRRAAWSAR